MSTFLTTISEISCLLPMSVSGHNSSSGTHNNGTNIHFGSSWLYVRKSGCRRGEFPYTKGRCCLLRIALNTKQYTTGGNVRSGRPLTFQPVSRRKPVHSPTRFSLCGACKSFTEERSVSESQWNKKKFWHYCENHW